MADFKSHQVLSKFISACEHDFSQPTKPESLEQSIKTLKLAESASNSTLPRLSCRLCGIDEFENLAGFKAHRQSSQHWSKLTSTIENSGTEAKDDTRLENQKVGSPFITLNHKTRSITLYKVLIGSKKDPLMEQSSVNLDHELFALLDTLRKDNVLIALNGGGYFAAGLFSLSQQKLLYSKTFKRYTSRRKQGGSQSSKDNSVSGNIHSAGAIIRRENEKKLREEIAQLFARWESQMQPVQIFSNRDPYLLETLSKYGKPKTLPFTTYQACHEEVCRCFNELLSIKTE